MVTLAISLITSALLSCNNIQIIDEYCHQSSLVDWNIAVVSICIAGLAILFGLFAGKPFDSDGSKAFNEQLISFFLCCFIHVLALFVTLLWSNEFCIILFQIWGLLLFLDLLVELYTMSTAITSKSDETDKQANEGNNKNHNKLNNRQNEKL